MPNRFKKMFLGNPLASHRERHERLSIPIGLAVFASDALSSTAYATEEILIALFAAGLAPAAMASAFNGALAIPVAIAITILMLIVVLSYREVIFAHPNGGGSYEVAKTKLGVLPSQIAGAALLIDYVLTVSVSVTSGVANIISIGWVPPVYAVSLSVILVLAIMFLNLRGVKESGKAFAVPAFIFIFSMIALIGTGIWRVMTGEVGAVTSVATVTTQVQSIAPLVLAAVLIRAFSHGCAALTGVEAVSNGVQAFNEPSDKNAAKTMVYMAVVLATMFIGITYLAYALPTGVPHIAIAPGVIFGGHPITVIAQVAAGVFGYGTWPFLIIQIITALILVLAANTSFAGFPRLGMILAQDGYLPRQLTNLGDRLVYSNGIVILSLFAILLIIIFHADYNAMMPLYAIGVFLSFTIAQGGMVKHHRNGKKPGWQYRAVVNSIGAVATGVVTLILVYEKFTEGAWIVLVAMPIIIWLFREIHEHYRKVNKQLALPVDGYCPLGIEHTVLVLVSSLHRGTIPALEYAKTISDRVEAVHVELNPVATARLKRAWEEWGCGITLTILKSPYRSISEPLLEYIDEVEDRYEHDLVTIIVPEFVTKKGWHNLLHNQTSIMIKTLLRYRTNKVVTTVRYHLDE